MSYNGIYYKIIYYGGGFSKEPIMENIFIDIAVILAAFLVIMAVVGCVLTFAGAETDKELFDEKTSEAKTIKERT
jgi:hypothetical protein